VCLVCIMICFFLYTSYMKHSLRNIINPRQTYILRTSKCILIVIQCVLSSLTNSIIMYSILFLLRKIFCKLLPFEFQSGKIFAFTAGIRTETVSFKVEFLLVTCRSSAKLAKSSLCFMVMIYSI